MSGYTAPDSLVAALLSVEVYHSGGQVVAAPPGWEEFANDYDPTTGYYGEAWGQLALDDAGNPVSGHYTQIIQVNRGTVFTTGASGPQNVPAKIASNGTVVPAVNLGDTASDDFYNTIYADGSILFGNQPYYVASATGFYQQLASQYSTIPIIETGQSLGGATSDAVVAAHANTDLDLSAITFNALIYGNGNAGLTAAQAAALPITNYYVGNEILTQNVLSRNGQWATGGTQLGTNVYLPALPVGSSFVSTVGNLQTIHSAEAGLSQLFRALYMTPNAPLYTKPSTVTLDSAGQWLQSVFPDYPANTPELIQAILANPTSSNTTSPLDTPEQIIFYDLNDAVTVAVGGDSLASAEYVETVSQAEAQAGDRFQVSQLAPDASLDEAAVWQTSAYNQLDQLDQYSRTIVFTNGSYDVNAYTDRGVIQSSYSASPGGGISLQTDNAAGLVLDAVTLSPGNVLSVAAYASNGVPISAVSIAIGSGTVTGLSQEADQSVLMEVSYEDSSGPAGTAIGIVANDDGSLTLVSGDGEYGAGAFATFAPLGLNGDRLAITDTSGALTVAAEVANGQSIVVGTSTSTSAIAMQYDFASGSGALQLLDPYDFQGSIGNALPGDVIVLDALGADRVTQLPTATDPTLVIQNQETGRSHDVALDFGQSSDETISAVSDGSGDLVLTVGPLQGTVFGGTGGSTIQGGAGALFFGGDAGAVSVTGGSGNTTLFGATSDVDSILNGGSGSNILVAGYGASTLIGGAGGATEFARGSGPALMIGAAGNTVINGTTGTGVETIVTGQSTAFIALNDAADTVLGGSGAATLLGGSGNDVYGFIKGHAGGAETIEGFKPSDTIVFGGYGTAPIASEAIVHGSDVMTLSDGTVITLQAIDHKVFSGLQ
jgi:hypothetical protein